MLGTQLDQKAWLARIGHTGPLTPTLETLNQLIFRHSHSIPYETLDIMLGRPPKLDILTLQQKMIASGRGGYCFEQNMLFRAGLRSLGYRITSLQGRVVRGLEIDAPRPAIHMLLKVELPEGTYLADVGFGNLAPTCALKLVPQVEQETPHEVMRFIDIGGELTLQARLKHGWQHIYRVIPYPRYDGEYEITNLVHCDPSGYAIPRQHYRGKAGTEQEPDHYVQRACHSARRRRARRETLVGDRKRF
nr:arylamine N-acetyltransferase [Bradyrhizobium japonicum]